MLNKELRINPLLKMFPLNEKVVVQSKKKNRIVYYQQSIRNISVKPKMNKLYLKTHSATHRTKSKSRLLLNGVIMLVRDFIQQRYNKWYQSNPTLFKNNYYYLKIAKTLMTN